MREETGRCPHLAIFGSSSPLPAPLTRDFHVGVCIDRCSYTRSLQLARTSARRAVSKLTGELPRARCHSLIPLNIFKCSFCQVKPNILGDVATHMWVWFQVPPGRSRGAAPTRINLCWQVCKVANSSTNCQFSGSILSRLCMMQGLFINFK